MRLPLTIHIMVKDNAKTLARCLKSLDLIDCDVLVGDLGSRDGSASECAQRGATVARLTCRSDMSAVRNHLAGMSKTPWNMWLEPYEHLMNGAEEIKRLVLGDPSCHAVNVLQDKLLLKPARIWHRDTGARFRNRAFEVLSCKPRLSSIYIASSQPEPFTDAVESCVKWHSEAPLSAEPLYYLASAHLQRGNTDSFINYAEAYLHAEKKQQMSYFMTKYHLGLVHCYKTKDMKKCLENALPCVIAQPTMAEFWCLLGDAYYEMRDFDKATAFYSNAVVLGQRRRAESMWPMQIDKYKEYPESMVESCRLMVQSTKAYAGSVSK